MPFLYTGTDATCKRLKKYRDGIELIPINPPYSPMFYTNKEIEEKLYGFWAKS